MQKVLVAGATGYLGQHIVKVLQREGVPYLALARNLGRLSAQGVPPGNALQAEVTRAEELKGKLQGVSTIISTVGITRQKDGLTYIEVDYQANKNLLEEAKAAGVRKFVYVSALNGQYLRHLEMMAAKERFVDELKASGLDYTVLRPNGFFSDMRDFLQMAKHGRVFLFGHGEHRLNPIHGEDLAKVALDCLTSPAWEIDVGGPDVLTQNELAELALNAWGRPRRIVHFPDVLRQWLLKGMRIFFPPQTYGPIEFFLTMMGQDNVAPRYGKHRLADFFEQEAEASRMQESR